jgi:CDP-diacylglycerol---glycerol-3-phosphate 3-phosphatidyltransferase
VIDLACCAGLAAAALVLGIAYALRVFLAQPARDARIDRAGGSALLSKPVMQAGYWALRPIARACVALEIPANAVSWASLALAALAGIALAGGHFGVGAVLSVLSFGGDAVDGLVAREVGTASDSGEVLDAAVDRYAEFLVLGGVALFERSRPPLLLLALAAMAGGMMVSYSTAKAEALGVAPPRGAMRRQERAVYLVLGAALVPAASFACNTWHLQDWLASAPLVAVLTLVAAVANVSALRRLRAVALAASKCGPAAARLRAGADPLGRGPRAASDLR